jgi:hypothetical protein
VSTLGGSIQTLKDLKAAGGPAKKRVMPTMSELLTAVVKKQGLTVPIAVIGFAPSAPGC